MKQPEPGDAGFSFSKAIGWLLNVGRRLYERVGAGLGLVNAIRERFPGASAQEAGTLAAHTAGAVQAAEMIMRTPGESVIDFFSAPVIPGEGLWAGNTGEVWQVHGVATWKEPDGTSSFTSTTVYGTEEITRTELDQLFESVATQAKDLSPRENQKASAELGSVEYLYAARQY